MLRRDQTPPYEIMRGRSAGVGTEAPPAADTQAEPARRPVSKVPWWVGSSAPLVLRIPRGLAVAAVAGLLLLIVVAYWVGSVRGAAAGDRVQEIAQGIGERSGPAGWFESDEEEAYKGPEVEPPEKTVFDERRESGRWYLRLMTSTPEDCRRLADFMHSRGVAIQLVMRDNGRSCVAYAIDRGYRTDEKDQSPAQHYLGWMKQRGREWKLHNGGRGDDLSTMYYAQHRGK